MLEGHGEYDFKEIGDVDLIEVIVMVALENIVREFITETSNINS